MVKSAPFLFGLLVFAVSLSWNAYRTVYVYTTLPRAALIGDVLIATLLGWVAWRLSREPRP